MTTHSHIDGQNIEAQPHLYRDSFLLMLLIKLSLAALLGLVYASIVLIS
jgi:hypothetical protein